MLLTGGIVPGIGAILDLRAKTAPNPPQNWNGTSAGDSKVREREFFIDNLPVRIQFIIEMILVDRPCAMGD